MNLSFDARMGMTKIFDAVGGRYCENCHVAELETDPEARSGIRPYALDPERAKVLWAKTEEIAGERF